MNMSKHATTLFMGIIALATTGGAALAGEGGAPGYYQGFTPNSPSCPAIHYQFRGMSATPVGYVWFGDASGMSKATGTADLSTGAFHLTLASIDGKGPTGTVDGVKDPHTAVVTAELKGPGCSNLKLLPMTQTMDTGPNG
jgi:hypothetical protein